MELNNLKNSWKVLDEDLDKTEIVTNEQIKNIIMKKFETTLDKVRKQKKISLIASVIILLPFGAKMFIAGNFLQGSLFLIVLLPLYISGILDLNELNKLDINKLSPSELLLKLNNFKMHIQQKWVLSIPILAFLIYIFSMNGFFNQDNWIGFAIGISIAIPFVLIKQYKIYKNLRINLDELKDLKTETEES